MGRVKTITMEAMQECVKSYGVELPNAIADLCVSFVFPITMRRWQGSRDTVPNPFLNLRGFISYCGTDYAPQLHPERIVPVARLIVENGGDPNRIVEKRGKCQNALSMVRDVVNRLANKTSEKP